MYAYELLLKKHQLQLSELPEEVKIAIGELVKVEKGLKANQKACEKKGKPFKITESTEKKKKAMDAFAVRGIQDYLLDKEIDGEAPHDAKEILEDVNNDNKEGSKEGDGGNEPEGDSDKGNKIDLELLSLWEANIHSLTLDEIKKQAKLSYDVIFEAYEEGEENGLETSNFILIEKGDKFTLTKK